jgi:cell division protein FtsQ
MTERSSRSRVATDPRISRRRVAVARSKRRKIAAGAATLVALGVSAWAALASPLLAVDEVRVVGGAHTSASEIATAAGLDADDNLLLISTDRIADAAETLPWVKRAEVDRMLPGTVRVRITERVPALILSLGATRWTLDTRGHILTTGAARRGLPILGGVDTGDVEVGARLEVPELLDALQAFRSLRERVRSEVTAVIAPSPERISFSLADGTLIRFGAAENLRAKNEVLSALLGELRQEHRTVAYIDVRVPTNPAIAPATAAPQATPAATD